MKINVYRNYLFVIIVDQQRPTLQLLYSCHYFYRRSIIGQQNEFEFILCSIVTINIRPIKMQEKYCQKNFIINNLFWPKTKKTKPFFLHKISLCHCLSNFGQTISQGFLQYGSKSIFLLSRVLCFICINMIKLLVYYFIKQNIY